MRKESRIDLSSVRITQIYTLLIVSDTLELHGNIGVKTIKEALTLMAVEPLTIHMTRGLG